MTPDPPTASFDLTFAESTTLLTALQRYVRQWEAHSLQAGPDGHRPEEWTELRLRAGRLIWRLETARVSDAGAVQYSPEAVDPEGAPVGDRQVVATPTGWKVLESPQERPWRKWDSHAFSVERLPRDGDWTSSWTEATRSTRRFRAACSCGWRGQDLRGDFASGVEDPNDRERLYEKWNREHVPGIDERMRLNE